jgi:hypothetical protein
MGIIRFTPQHVCNTKVRNTFPYYLGSSLGYSHDNIKISKKRKNLTEGV